MNTHFIRISETRYKPEFQTEDQYRLQWQSALKRAHADAAEVYCECPGRGTKRLAPKHYAVSDKFGLARYPGTGEEHAVDCQYYAPNPIKSGLSGYAHGVIDEKADGVLGVRLGIGLKKRAAGDETNSGGEIRASTNGCKHPTMTNLGLLHLLWQEGNLHRWWPKMEGKRTINVVRKQTLHAAQKIRVGQYSLQDALLLPALTDGSSEAKRNAHLVESAIQYNRRLIAVNLLRPWNPKLDSQALSYLPITSAFGLPFLTLNAGAWKRLNDRFPYALSAWRQGQKVMALAVVEPAKNKDGLARTYVLSAALMAVTEQWIPIESSYEYEIAQKLVEQGRAFIKPLRFDASAEVVFPDFVLLDTQNADGTPMEVFGRKDEAYERRKAEKSRYYNEQYGVDGWWMWNAAAGEPIPEFPSSRGPVLP